MVCMLLSLYPPASLTVYLAGCPTETHPDTLASSVPSSSRAPSQPPEGRDLDWEDYNYRQDPAAAGGQQGDLEIPWQLYWQGFLTSTQKSWRLSLLRNLSVPDDARLPAGMTMEKAVEVSDTL